jgi:hypothetical protein
MIILVTSAFITFPFLLSQTVGKMAHNYKTGQIVLLGAATTIVVNVVLKNKK